MKDTFREFQHPAGTQVDAMVQAGLRQHTPTEHGLGTPEARAKTARTKCFHDSLPQYRKGSGGGGLVPPPEVIRKRGKGK